MFVSSSTLPFINSDLFAGFVNCSGDNCQIGRLNGTVEASQGRSSHSTWTFSSYCSGECQHLELLIGSQAIQFLAKLILNRRFHQTTSFPTSASVLIILPSRMGKRWSHPLIPLIPTYTLRRKRSVFEMTDARENHGDVVGVRGFDHVRIPN